MNTQERDDSTRTASLYQLPKSMAGKKTLPALIMLLKSSWLAVGLLDIKAKFTPYPLSPPTEPLATV